MLPLKRVTEAYERLRVVFSMEKLKARRLRRKRPTTVERGRLLNVPHPSQRVAAFVP
jgi:hypothetical protein